MTLPLTPSQTVGPFLAIGLTWRDGPYVVPDGSPGAIRISGQVSDGAGNPVPDAMIETWQADAEGRFAHPDDPRPASISNFRGFGRCATDDEGAFAIVTLKPGPLPGGDGRTEAPHIDVSVFARGLLDRLVTRIYFPDEAEANAKDPLLSSLPGSVRDTLIAVWDGENLRFDIRLQGQNETAFFEL
jgi:protocatechuate 3,4-dioxygenase, alpha subunit